MTKQDIEEAIFELRSTSTAPNSIVVNAPWSNILAALIEVLEFALRYLIKDGKLKGPGLRIWLWPKMIRLIIQLVTRVVRTIANS